ncbi:pentatricopeptide repeat-containing protein At4g35850, mitochondrial [Rhodamnia argentea]|uniref:Pentatricopeptide repeat-containing protein At4g35850, mitochondrial n=1 Tax=Rhodamnia argentea TaxID=178133 RepID=A0A8B8P887_9MYRT|nr:pentatricopeptide repeat-containing protein At4g35850, mitochondrial [Rhodamnia argentea]
MMKLKLLQYLGGQRTPLFRAALGRRHYAASAAELEKRNYAKNATEYNTVLGSLTAQRRYGLLRDVYDDMTLDGVQPTRDVFHSLIVGTMRGSRLQDAFFFRDEMKSMGLVPDVPLYSFLISTCGKCRNSDQAIRILEEMKKYEVKPNGQTYVCLLNACAAAGRLDRVYAIVRDMTAAGAGLNKFCYAGLITAHKNKMPLADDTAAKIIELVEQSKGWSSVEASNNVAENVMIGVSEEELYNLPTAEYVHRRGGFVIRQFTVYHVAFHAFADLRNVEAMETLLEMLQKDGKTPDVFILMQIMRCYLHSGDIDRGLKVFEDYVKSGKFLNVEFYVTLVEGAMTGYTPRGMQLAQETLEQMNSRNFFLSPKMGSDLLLIAAGEKDGGYTTANFLWDMMQTRKLTPSLPAVEAYYKGLKDREIPEDDPRLFAVSKVYDNLRLRFGPVPRPARP